MTGALSETGIFVGGGGEGYATAQELLLKYGNRHGLIAGATGTGKTVTLQVLAEGFSAAGVPVFMADVKGDLAGMAMAGSATAKTQAAFEARSATIGYDLSYRGFPVTFWDVFGTQGHPVRATVSEMGPLLLARLLGLSEAQEGVLNVAFSLADSEGLALLDLADLRAMLAHVGERASELSLRYGNIAPQSVGSIQRQLLVLENQGAAQFFGEPALELADMMAPTPDGRGRINILAADKLMASPRLYATLLLWLMSELFEELPEVGDPDRPRLVFFFDEAHLLFDDAPKALVDKVEQVARLIRSKGVGIYFVTQNPGDVPDDILGQLGNRVQHALRAFTAKDQKDLKRAAENYRPNPRFDTETAIKEVGTGEAVTSFLEAKGVPGMVERTLVRPPQSRLGPLTTEERRAVIAASPYGAKYDTAVDRESAYEILTRKAGASAGAQGAEAQEPEDAPPAESFNKARRIGSSRPTSVPSAGSRSVSTRRGTSDTILETFGKSIARQVGSQAGSAIVRGILGSLYRSR
ncbi:helicase HerA-like domain-containing protein [Paenirhodobacter enshiensis]|uniref:Helicase HerA-like C-terminal domain-containing protein n=1 Tax=Paenirhodobacter enshiensis TaxID=1105367 RepID=A0A086Y1E0_9RHOB|nr:helicase HerA-like domain-containing protein [Paenirhodobacter enshiensis]KFI28090.1 hypothetical protein CG50_14350 [Paenirhodobacter enshiensis]